MNPRYAFALKLIAAIAVVILLAFLFPPIADFIDMAGRELRYVWWVVFLVLLAIWLIWGLGRKK